MLNKYNRNNFFDELSKFNLVKIAVYLLFGIYIIGLVSLLYLPRNINLKVGMKSPVTIISPKQVEVETSEDKLISERLLEQKILEIKPVYKRDRLIESTSQKNLENIFIINRETPEKTISNLELLPLSKRLFVLDENSLANIKAISIEMMKNIYNEGLVNTENMAYVMRKYFKELNINPKYQVLVSAILTTYLAPNLLYDEIANSEQIEALKRHFIRQSTLIKKGQPIVYKDDIIRSNQLEILSKIGLYRNEINFLKLISLIFGVMISLLVLERRMTYYIGPSNKQMILLFCIESVYISIIYFLLLYDNLPEFIVPAYWIPVTFFTFILSLLLSEKLSLLMSNLNTILILFLFNINPQAVLFMMIMTMGTNIFIHRFKKRSDIPFIGFAIGMLSMAVVFVIEINISQNSIDKVLIHSLQVFVNSVLSIIIAIGTLPYLEQMFNITTDLKLLDYGDLNNELMQRMLREAPGTYYHSLMVSNLAEAAAEEIEANGVLARVASYYHDVGKLKKPEYFIENQNQQENPHDHTMPTLSALTILSHPKDGVELAKKYNLPVEIRNIIQEHHGSSLLVYFYHKMLRITLHDIVEESQFRYDCPQPTSKESAIIMLADSVEAAVRSLENPTPTKIMSMIDKIFHDKLADGQLDHCELSMANFETIKSVFLGVIINQYHNRIKYPENHEKNEEIKQCRN